MKNGKINIKYPVPFIEIKGPGYKFTTKDNTIMSFAPISKPSAKVPINKNRSKPTVRVRIALFTLVRNVFHEWIPQ